MVCTFLVYQQAGGHFICIYMYRESEREKKRFGATLADKHLPGIVTMCVHVFECVFTAAGGTRGSGSENTHACTHAHTYT